MADPVIAGIYAIRNAATGRVYVGSSCNISRRWKEHRTDLRRGKHHSPKLQKSWDKYGECSFEFSLLEAVADNSLLAEREQVWMDALSATLRTHGFNIFPNARRTTGRTHSAETREKIRLIRLGTKRGPETRARISEAQVGRTITPAHAKAMHSAWRGQKHSQEVKDKLRALKTGKALTAEARAKISEKLTGVSHTRERRAAQSARMMGHATSEETRRKIGKAHSGKTNPTVRKLTFADAEMMRALKSEGFTRSQLVERFNCNRGTVEAILTGKTYRS